ncbi:MAG: CCA tRNA nucleotidyltransferase, partial [Candidatus Dadabacteria bacterium]
LNGGITEIDFASTREEYYPSPGSLPEVKLSDINHDLLRRDFTVNAMAISLANLLDPRGNSFSNLVLDPYGGKEDLKAKKIEVIHSKSFIDDPTRMLRACRYAIRIGGLIGKRTEELLQKALQDGAIDYVSYQRIDRELYKALDDPCAKEILSLMTNHSLLSRIGYFDPCSEPISQTALEWVIGESNLLEERYERLFALFAKIGSQQETEARLKKAGISKKRIKKIIDMSYELPCKF